MNRHLAVSLRSYCKEVLISIPPPHLCLVRLIMRQITCTRITAKSLRQYRVNLISCISQIKDGS